MLLWFLLLFYYFYTQKIYKKAHKRDFSKKKTILYVYISMLINCTHNTKKEATHDDEPSKQDLRLK